MDNRTYEMWAKFFRERPPATESIPFILAEIWALLKSFLEQREVRSDAIAPWMTSSREDAKEETDQEKRERMKKNAAAIQMLL